jgi:chromosome segregation protein
MYLKNLTVLGFKSFADKTALNFMPGITAVVGPNGCGKSNVADAIRWVLGEQSAKALRGGEMADVIFNGTDHRKPLGMAEVSITLGDVDHENLRAAGIDLDFSEVTVTRRVFRDGGSEYFINKTSCRLKDIQQLFMGTGLGRSSYSIMAQGHITQLLSSRPEDRRMVFEEAAGITRFKAQKKEALRKLDSTEQNLLRVTDLIREVKRQIGSLQRQAGKARRYKQFMVELQHLDTQLARHQFDVLQAEIHERELSAQKLRVELELCSESALREEDEIAQLRERMSVLEHEISLAQQQSLELKGQIDRHDGRIHYNKERLQELEQTNSKALSDIAQGEERRMVAEQELASIKDRLSVSTVTLEQHRLELESKRVSLQQVEEGVRAHQDQLRQAQSGAFAAAQQLSRIRNEITALEMQQQGNVGRLEKLSSEKVQLEEERQRLELRLNEFATSVETEKIHVQAQRGTLEEQQSRLRQLQQDQAQATRELDELLRQQAGSRSKATVLEQLQAAHEGFSAGTLAALKQAPHMLGALADKIRVSQEYISAIEAALGHHLQLVLTDQPETAQQILADLKANRKGRASIAALALSPHGGSSKEQAKVAGSSETERVNDSPSPAAIVAADANATPTPSANSEAGVEGKPGFASVIPAMSVVESDDSIRPLLESLLGQTFIAPDMATAIAAWKEFQGEFDIVTLQGETLSHHGIFSGGSGNGGEKSPASFLGRKNQIAELQAQLAQIQDQVNEASRRKGGMQSEQTELQVSLQQSQSELRTQEVAIATHQGECRALENALRVLHQKIDTVMYEIKSLAGHEEESQKKRLVLSSQIGDLDAREKSFQQQIADATNGIETLRQERDTANNSLTETKVALAGEEQLMASFRQQLRSLEYRIQELIRLVEARQNEIESLVERRGQFQAEMEESRLRIEGLQHERESVGCRAANLLSEKEGLNGEISSKDDILKERRRRLTDLQQRRGELDVQLAQKTMTVQNLRERIQQKYQLNLDDVRGECITITIASEGPPKVETLTPQEMAARGLSTDWEGIADQVTILQKRIDEMGPVNLVAIEEYEETEQRYQFLTTQNDDLVKAKEQLLDVINKINTQTQEMFIETFNKVRENFSVLFTEIFGGGKADLMLVNEGDVLESGIDILARPPGKQLKSITLLSGGEQTMTAVALLFAIYQVKPSPFCVLDELDAPLDESNVNRFIGVLKRFLVNSQFIIITHNKRTIGMADVIYGVTMQEHGVSKIVSMKFHKTTGTSTESTTGQLADSADTKSGSAELLPAPVAAPFVSAIDRVMTVSTPPPATLPSSIGAELTQTTRSASAAAEPTDTVTKKHVEVIMAK